MFLWILIFCDEFVTFFVATILNFDTRYMFVVFLVFYCFKAIRFCSQRT